MYNSPMLSRHRTFQLFTNLPFLIVFESNTAAQLLRGGHLSKILEHQVFAAAMLMAFQALDHLGKGEVGYHLKNQRA